MRWPLLPLAVLAVACEGRFNARMCDACSSSVDASSDADDTADAKARDATCAGCAGGSGPIVGAKGAEASTGGVLPTGFVLPTAVVFPSGASLPTGDRVVVLVGEGARRVRIDAAGAPSGFAEIDPNGGDDNHLLRGVSYYDGRFVAVGGSSVGLTMTSLDGLTWEHETRTLGSWLGNSGRVGELYVAAGGNGMRATSNDKGASWTAIPNSYLPVHYRDLASNGSIAVAAGHIYGADGAFVGCGSYAGVISWTDNGTEWTHVGLGGGPGSGPGGGGSGPCGVTGSSIGAIAYGNGRFVVAGFGGHVRYSLDGKVWTEPVGAPVATNDIWISFVHDTFYLWVQTAAGTSTYRSQDGAAWTDAFSQRALVGLTADYVGLTRGSHAVYFGSSLVFNPSAGTAGFYKAAANW